MRLGVVSLWQSGLRFPHPASDIKRISIAVGPVLSFRKTFGELFMLQRGGISELQMEKGRKDMQEQNCRCYFYSWPDWETTCSSQAVGVNRSNN